MEHRAGCVEAEGNLIQYLSFNHYHDAGACYRPSGDDFDFGTREDHQDFKGSAGEGVVFGMPSQPIEIVRLKVRADFLLYFLQSWC